MTQPPTGSAAFGPGDSVTDAWLEGQTTFPEQPHQVGGRSGSRRLPGGRVVLVATAGIVAMAMFEVLERERIGLWTGITLVAVSAVAVLITKPGDRSLPAMMPPLAFVTAVAVAGQRLVNLEIDDPRRRQAVMLVETLGENAVWVVTATAVAVVLALIGHLVTRRSSKREAEPKAVDRPRGIDLSREP